jgi:7-cyano-7-deazaguanine synthase
MEGNKFTILQDGESCCECLGLDFDTVYFFTNTSYKPIYHQLEWYSDFKSASSVERVEAFMKLGRPDPVEYADETGPVSWETVVKHVETILNNHNK